MTFISKNKLTTTTLPVRKVVLLCDFFSSLGGTEAYNAALARGLKARGIDVRIYTGEKPPIRSWITQLRTEGFIISEPETYHEDLSSRTIEEDFMRNIVDGINEWKPDVIHVHPFKKMAIQWLANPRSDSSIPIVATEWTVPSDNSAHWFEFDTKKYVNQITTYIATCRAITKGIRDYHKYSGDIVSIPHLIESMPSTRLNHDEASLQSVGCISRLSPEKGLVFLIGAWKSVVEHYPNQTLHIYGHGPEQASLRLLRDCLNLKDSIIFEGTYEPGSVEKIAARHSIFVQPSLFESIPTSIIELMLSGRVVVASDVGGVSELVKSGRNGTTVKPASTEELAVELIKLISSPDLIENYSRASYDDSHTLYNYDQTMDKIVALYSKVKTT